MTKTKREPVEDRTTTEEAIQWSIEEIAGLIHGPVKPYSEPYSENAPGLPQAFSFDVNGGWPSFRHDTRWTHVPENKQKKTYAELTKVLGAAAEEAGGGLVEHKFGDHVIEFKPETDQDALQKALQRKMTLLMKSETGKATIDAVAKRALEDVLDTIEGTVASKALHNAIYRRLGELALEKGQGKGRS